MGRRWVRVLLALSAVLALLLLVACVTPQGRTAAKTAGLVVQVLPDMPVQPLGWFTREPERFQVTYPSPVGPAEADLYRRPDREPQAALVLFLGVNPAGRDDERVVNIATALARTGFAVLVPWSENMVSGRVAPSDIELLVAAFEYLKTLDFVDAERIGSGGFCVGSSLLVVAAADERVRDDVQFINFFSGYYDGRDFLAQFGARQAFYRDTARPWDVDPLTEEVFRRLLIEGLPDRVESIALARQFMGEWHMTPEQVDALSPAALEVYARLAEGTPTSEAIELIAGLDNPGARVALTRHFLGHRQMTPNEVGALSSGGAAVHGLLSGTETVQQAHALVEQLPQGMLADIDVLSPRHSLEGLRADLWIMHDVDDQLAPVEESWRLYDVVGERENVRFTEFSFFQHVDPSADAGFFNLVGESWRLLRHLYRVVRWTA